MNFWHLSIAALPWAVILLAGAATAAENGSPPAGAVATWDAAKSDVRCAPDLTGNGNAAALKNVSVMKNQEDLVERPYFYFDGNGAHAEARSSASLNMPFLTIAAWVKPEEDSLETQKPVLAKSLPAHVKPWYQYAIFLMDSPEHPRSVSLNVSARGKHGFLEARDVLDYTGWNFIAATYDGSVMRLFMNGSPVAACDFDGGQLDKHDTPVLIGAYANLDKTSEFCFRGSIGSIAVFGRALTGEEIKGLYDKDKSAYPAGQKAAGRTESEYECRLNDALRKERDVWGEELIAKGGATYENIKDYLRPLFYSTGHNNKTLGVHNLLYGENGGKPPYIIPLADGSRIAGTIYNSPRFIEFFVGPEGNERYGSELARLKGPFLEGDYHPILKTGYSERGGTVFSQESFAARAPGLDHLAAYVKLSADRGESARDATRLVVKLGKTGRNDIRHTGSPEWRDDSIAYEMDIREGGGQDIYLLWSPQSELPAGAMIDKSIYEEAKRETMAYWDGALSRGTLFEVPEKLVMDVQRNLLIQNLIMRWRYSVGSVVYHGAFYQPESSEASTVLGLFGFPDESRESLDALVGMAKGSGPDYYTNWERGEKLSHGAHFFLLIRDGDFINRHTAEYQSYCDDFLNQIENDPNGMLRKERHCGDIPVKAYATFQQAVAWRGMRDMAEVWGIVGREDLRAKYAPAAKRLRSALRDAVKKSGSRLTDGSLFVPNMLLVDDFRPFSPITQSRMGSYWNLCMPYAFSSGLWDPRGEEMDGIVSFLHNHGATMLGLIRFNYYPTRIGSFRSDGLPGYYTTGFDNVYLPAYVQLMADRDEAERLILSFYGKLAHGQTRNTFVCGEGDSVGARPAEYYRSCYGSPCSGNNAGFLLALRLMLVNESFDDETGLPNELRLAHAAPRQWLDHGKRINISGAPTCFGPVSCEIVSKINDGIVTARMEVPERNTIPALKLKLRVPGGRRMKSVAVNGKSHDGFDAATEIIDLSGLTESLDIVVRYE
ncbi:MAG TPA: LamG domain-containing protein [Candidatus Brocadiia bacterium]|nr:LamG domain-containing protein [Candidatus Brocadiia bacterium]